MIRNIDTRSQVQTDQDKAALRSLFELRDVDKSKPVDLYFGPAAPAGAGNRWIETTPGRGWFSCIAAQPMPKNPTSALAAALAVQLLATAPALAQSSEDMNAANNPLTPTIGVNLQDQYVGRYYGLGDADGNTLLLRGTLPHKLFGMPQILRLTMPVVTTPDAAPFSERFTGAGDLNLFDVFLFKAGGVELGVGPQLTMPTASRDQTGAGKWQGGVAAVAMAPQKWGLAGGLLTWQKSFAGDDDRPQVDSASLQPFFIYNLPQGWYFRSSATWNFNLRSGDYSIPVGAGMGKVWKMGGTTYNLFAEPQWTVSHQGEGQPKFQVFMGLNLQFPL